MRFGEAYRSQRPGLSFEVFPPKTAAGEQVLLRHVEQLVRLQPRVVTCTYGAGGTTRDKTLHITATVRERFGVSVAAHLTCVGSSISQIREYLREAAALGIENIVALRGDPPQGQTHFQPAADGLAYAGQLVKLIRAEFPEFGIAVAGYPETHREARSPEEDLENLHLKVAEGADVVITQLFYDNDDFFRFRERCDVIGIRVPIVPGLLPITSLAQIQRITSLCGARLPKTLLSALTAVGDDEVRQFALGVEFATRQTEGLLAAGVPGIHYYVLNKSEAAAEVIRNAGL